MKAAHRSIMFITAGLLVSTVVTGMAGPASAAPAQSGGGAGGASSSMVNVSVLARTPDTTTPPQQTAPLPRHGQAIRPALPSKPTVGTRPALPATGPATGSPNSGEKSVVPLAAPAVVANFDGVDEATGCTCEPPDVNAAVSPTQIAEVVNRRLQIYSKTGDVQCGGGVTLNRFLRSTDVLADPRVQYDNVNDRFIMSATVVPASTTATPAMWVAGSSTGDACGTWFVYRLTFNGTPFPAGTLLDYPMLGQDRNALLIATANFTPSNGVNFTVYGVAKSKVYTGATVSFSTFNTASLSAPVSNGGIPMISTPFSYFVSAVPGTGYRLYRLTNSGGPGASLTLQATISSSFAAPTRRVNQPGTTNTLDPQDGRIVWSPVNDGSQIWFAHGYNLAGFPTVRYGAINISNNTVTVAAAFHTSTSDDFNPSIGVGLSPGGGQFLYLNWAYTDTPNNVATSDTVDTVAPFGGIPNLIGTGVVLVNGSTTTFEGRFGDYSSVAIDPTVVGGSCAVAAQQYFGTDGTWHTRIARVGTCQPSPVVPDVRGDDPSTAAGILIAAGLTVGQIIGVTDNTCNNIGTVASQSPSPGTQVPPGTAVNLFIGQMPPPPFQCP